MQKTQLTSAIQEFERLKEAAISLRDKLYLDGVIAVLVGYLPQEREDIEKAHYMGLITTGERAKWPLDKKKEYFNKTFTQYKP